jgi:hypothetical protein
MMKKQYVSFLGLNIDSTINTEDIAETKKILELNSKKPNTMTVFCEETFNVLVNHPKLKEYNAS